MIVSIKRGEQIHFDKLIRFNDEWINALWLVYDTNRKTNILLVYAFTKHFESIGWKVHAISHDTKTIQAIAKQLLIYESEQLEGGTRQ